MSTLSAVLSLVSDEKRTNLSPCSGRFAFIQVSDHDRFVIGENGRSSTRFQWHMWYVDKYLQRTTMNRIESLLTDQKKDLLIEIDRLHDGNSTRRRKRTCRGWNRARRSPLLPMCSKWTSNGLFIPRVRQFFYLLILLVYTKSSVSSPSCCLRDSWSFSFCSRRLISLSISISICLFNNSTQLFFVVALTQWTYMLI